MALPYGLSVLTRPAVEPVSLDDAKLHLRVEHTADDPLIRGLIAAARQWCEEYAERAFVSTGYRLTLDRFPSLCGYPWGYADAGTPLNAYWPHKAAIRLPRGPVTAVTAVSYYDAAGDLQTLAANADYQTALDREPPLVAPMVGTTWPVAQSGRLGAVRVDFTAGYGATGAGVPDAVKQAVLLLVGQRYERRGDDDVTGNADAAAVHPAVKALLGPYRTSLHS